MKLQPKLVRAAHPHEMFISRCTQTERDKPERIEIPGLNKFQDRSYSLLFKFVWFIIVVACFGCCFYQIGIRVSCYLAGSISLEVEMKPQTSFFFPSITTCSSYLLYMLFEYQNRTSDRKFINNQTINLDSNTIWNTLSVINFVGVYPSTAACFFEKANNSCLKYQTDFVDTILGRCSKLIIREKMKYRGHFTFIDLAWKDVETFYSFTKPFGDNLIFYLHSDTFEHAHDGMLTAENALVGFFTDFRIHAEEFKNLNLRHNPCAPAEQVVKCVNDCINQVLLKRLNCGLPFVNSTLPKCTTLYQTMENYAHIILPSLNLQSHLKSCQCKRKCNEIKYTLHKDTERKHDLNLTLLRLLYADETHMIIIEREMFPISALFSDIGGTIGLYLGISMLTISDFFCVLIRRCLSKVLKY